MDNYSVVSKTILFTGATSGLGRLAALKVAAEGAKVIVTYRDKNLGEKLKKDLHSLYPSAKGSIELLECNLSSLSSVHSACQQLKNTYETLDMIVNNAGTWNFEFSETEDGIENTLQVNLLAPMLIINQLREVLRKSDSPKIINTASALHQGSINFDNLEFRKNFSGFKAYRQSKLGIILISRYYQKKFENSGIHFYSQHPGLVDTGLVRKGGWLSKQFFKFFGKSPEKGAETLIHLILSSPTNLRDGEYFKNCKVSKTDTKESYNLKVAEKLDNVCLQYLDKYLVD
jgi:NAD(P)-dependent dehydrogenase (short-subunit alcohol dehydrogenase family)